MNEDTEGVFVLADEYASTPEAARDVLFAQAPKEWLTLEKDDPAALPTHKQWYRLDERTKQYKACISRDKRRDSEWWVFEMIAPGKSHDLGR